MSEPNPSIQCPLVPTSPLTGDRLLSQASGGDREKTGLMAGVGEGELLEPGPQSRLGECMGWVLAVRDISKPLDAV